LLVHKLVELHGGSVESSAGEQGIESSCGCCCSSKAQPDATALDGANDDGATEGRILIADTTTRYVARRAAGLAIRCTQRETANKRSRSHVVPAGCGAARHGMPRLDGYMLASKMRDQDATRCDRITGWGQAEDRRRSLEVVGRAHGEAARFRRALKLLSLC
jgi:hypothetical protein